MKIVPADISALIVAAEAKLSPSTGYASYGKWVDAINHIRWDAYLALGADPYGNVVTTDYRQICSGPWCVAGGANSLTGMFLDVFWVGPNESGRLLNVNAGGQIYFYSKSGIAGGWNAVHHLDPTIKNARWEFKIGGDTGVNLKIGDASGRGKASIALYDVDDNNRTSPATITVSSNVPGLTHAITGGGSNGFLVSFSADSTASPGDYFIEMTVTSAHYIYDDLFFCGIEISVESGSNDPHGAIHDTLDYVKMVAPQRPSPSTLPFGIFSDRLWPRNQGYGPTWVWREEKLSVEAWSVTGVTTGHWFAKTLPICWREIQLQAYMPPNHPPLPGPWTGPIESLYRDINPAKEVSVNTDSVIVPVTPASTYRAARHPAFRDTDTVPSWAGMYSPPFWYIREVVVRRLPVLDENHIMHQPDGAVSFALGCMRNGVFTAFPDGTGNVGPDGLTRQVKWPVISLSPLRYQCSEQLLVYAYVSFEINQFDAGIWAHSIQMPPLIDHLEDTYTLLGLV